MLTQAEVIAQLKQVSADLKEGNAAIAVVQNEVSKVGADTDNLGKQIADLKVIIDAGGTITQELQDAVADVAVQAGTVKSGIASVGAALQVVDDKVPDLVVPPPAP